ncbi:hypothetical protein TorRG33x02_235470 [Trema orientale]|uniref:Uncharacterized protein n=1 Tax=Trema orientale TaxID=63057 RepID=A0A2P5E218_TREOI|nr:hypothetical protein TorRG33x02_235470 [Trema orientale]
MFEQITPSLFFLIEYLRSLLFILQVEETGNAVSWSLWSLIHMLVSASYTLSHPTYHATWHLLMVAMVLCEACNELPGRTPAT